MNSTAIFVLLSVLITVSVSLHTGFLFVSGWPIDLFVQFARLLID